MKRLVASLPPPPPKPRAGQSAANTPAPEVPQIRPSASFREYRGRSFRLSYPEDWQAKAAAEGEGVTIAPPEGMVNSGAGTAIGIGVMAGFSASRDGLRVDTDALVRQLGASNQALKVRSSRDTQVAGLPALDLNLESASPYAGATEVDQLLTVERPDGLFYLLLIAPEHSLAGLQSVFERIAGSLRFDR
jgi:hypothetical protein